jgi:hypothetical protein
VKIRNRYEVRTVIIVLKSDLSPLSQLAPIRSAVVDPYTVITYTQRTPFSKLLSYFSGAQTPTLPFLTRFLTTIVLDYAEGVTREGTICVWLCINYRLPPQTLAIAVANGLRRGEKVELSWCCDRRSVGLSALVLGLLHNDNQLRALNWFKICICSFLHLKMTYQLHVLYSVEQEYEC